jgi:segregation and condensation protein B
MTTSALNLLEEMLETVSPSSEELAAEGRLSPEQQTELKNIIESLLFATQEPLPFRKIRDVVTNFLPVPQRLIFQAVQELRAQFQEENRPLQIDEIAGGYILRTKKEYAPYVQLLYSNKRGDRLTQAAAEVLALIAYRQPITRPQIDKVRGVDSSGAVSSLMERGLIEAVGKADAPGRPTLYGTTSKFLQHFGLRELNELPRNESLKA